MHPDVENRLARLAPDQRAAATAPSGPILCVAPAGSGKTTTLVARVAWLVGGGTPTHAIRAITFNKRAAEEMTERLDGALEPLGIAAGAVAVRTFHALGREILRDAGIPVEPLADRDTVLRAVRRDADAAERMRLDTAISRLKLELGVTADEVAADPEAGPTAQAFVAYERALAATGGLDFDDLVLRAIQTLEHDHGLLARWRGTLPRAARRRGAGRRPGAAQARPVARGARQSDLPRRRRRPEHLWVEARRRPPRARSRRCPARAATRRPGGEPSLSAADRRARGPARRPQPRAVREADQGRDASNGQPGACAGRQRRDGPPPARARIMAGRWIDAGGPGADQPRAAAGRRRGPRARLAIPGTPNRAARRVAAGRRGARTACGAARRPGTAAGRDRPAPDRGAGRRPCGSQRGAA